MFHWSRRLSFGRNHSKSKPFLGDALIRNGSTNKSV